MAKPVATLTQGRSAQAQTSVNEDDVRRLAYELYERRGRQAGLEQEDWLKAEQLLRQRRRSSS